MYYTSKDEKNDIQHISNAVYYILASYS